MEKLIIVPRDDLGEMDEEIKCPHCGVPNPSNATACRICGRPLTAAHADTDSRACISCGQVHTKKEETCSHCGMPLREVAVQNLPGDLPTQECVHWSEAPASAGRSAKVSVAGVLVLIAGFLGIAQAVFAFTPDIGEGFMRTYEDLIPMAEPVDSLLEDFVVLQGAILVFGVVAIFGSMFALNRSRFDMALVGAVFGILAVGFFMGALFSILGLLLIATSRKEFLPECA